ncbi:hypothetical protein D910_00786 [Dendroctonus ponderosae]|uniref:DUF5641 domain-containing protein n=1 Tax=Dendroctonus ponderosae TaxID=77166 RepID=U4USA8_DENPD|nr:hypothetical protein D910_00786 [Dendroctonus ponderosae]
MVLLQEDNVPPLHWSFGRIVQVMPGSDGTSVLYRLNPILKAVEAATSRGGECWEMSK